jgi:UDP-glucose 6-dehydrogenase
VAIGKALKEKESYTLIVTRSTVVPGTTRDLILPLLEEHSGKKAGENFGICMSPEFLRQGAAVHDTRFPDSESSENLTSAPETSWSISVISSMKARTYRFFE